MPWFLIHWFHCLAVSHGSQNIQNTKNTLNQAFFTDFFAKLKNFSKLKDFRFPGHFSERTESKSDLEERLEHLELRASKGCKREDFGKYRFHAVEDFDLTFSG